VKKEATRQQRRKRDSGGCMRPKKTRLPDGISEVGGGIGRQRWLSLWKKKAIIAKLPGERLATEEKEGRRAYL